MSERTYLVVSSATAYVDPWVSVHVAGCEHAERLRLPDEWEVHRVDGRDQAHLLAVAECRRLGVDPDTYAWMDCAL